MDIFWIQKFILLVHLLHIFWGKRTKRIPLKPLINEDLCCFFFVFILIKTIRLTWECHLNSIITITSPVLASGRDNTDAEIGLYVTLDPARIY